MQEYICLFVQALSTLVSPIYNDNASSHSGNSNVTSYSYSDHVITWRIESLNRNMKKKYIAYE